MVTQGLQDQWAAARTRLDNKKITETFLDLEECQLEHVSFNTTEPSIKKRSSKANTHDHPICLYFISTKI